MTPTGRTDPTVCAMDEHQGACKRREGCDECGFMRLKDRVAIVTGGGKGIGKAISLALAREDATVVVAGRTLSALQETCDEIKSKGGNATPVQTDVTIEEQVIRMVSETIKAFGKVDILVNNSGVAGPIVRLADMDLARWNETIAIDLTGSMLSCREVLNYGPSEEGRHYQYCFPAGTAGDGKSGFPLRSAYCAAKMGLIGMTETLAIEVGEFNIRVNAVSPGPVRGEHITNAMMGKARATNRPFEEIMKDLAAGSSLKRISEESEIASAVVFLASDEASAIQARRSRLAVASTSCSENTRLSLRLSFSEESGPLG